MSSSRHRARVAVVAVLWLATVALLVVSMIFSPFDGTTGATRVVTSVGFVVAMASLPTVGGVVLLRRPGNVVGWLLVATAPGWGLLLAASAATHHLVDTGHPVPGQQMWNWLEAWVGFVSFNALLLLLMLVFPTGRLLSRRWVGAVAVIVLGAVTGGVGSMFAPGGLADYPHRIDNPLGVGGTFGRFCLWLRDDVGWLLFAVGAVLALVSVIVRYRRAVEVERAQLKWMVYAASLWMLVFPAWMVAPKTLGEPATELAVVALPLATGIAVLRYRLYDIDRIISRTISYTLLTALVVALFVGVVALVTHLTPVSSQLGVAAATLTCAAFVNPFRRRLQRWVDRRFNRAPVDAARTIDVFIRALNDEVDLESVRKRLLTTVGTSLQPVSVSLWMTS